MNILAFDNFFFDSDEYVFYEDKALGKGAFGTVYIAKKRGERDEKEYAIKIIQSRNKIFSADEQKLLLRESIALYQVDHPAIIKFRGVSFQAYPDPPPFTLRDGTSEVIDTSKKLNPAIVTDYLPNGSLKDIARNKKWNPTKEYIALLGIADAMRYLHQIGIVHRDLKPDNVLINSKLYPCICDLGLSRQFNGIQNSMSMTTLIGTPLYMAPEMFDETDHVSPKKVDVYSFAILAYEIVTKRRPFYHITFRSINQLRKLVVKGERPIFNDVKIDEKIKNLITKCWSNDPSERPSFDVIFKDLATNITYHEKIDKKEINDYIQMLLDHRTKELPDSKNQLNYNSDLILGLNSIHGNPKEKNNDLAITYLKRASEQNDGYASYLLGLFYENGEKVPKNFDIATKYYEEASKQGNSYGYNRIGYCYKNGFGVAQNIKKASDYYKKSLNQNNPLAYNNMGILYNKEGNETQAINCFINSYKLGSSTGLYNLGCLYEKGSESIRDYNLAAKYYKDAIENGNPFAFNNLGFLYQKGLGIRQNYKKAKECYEEGSKQGDPSAMFNLGFLYIKPYGVDQDYGKGIDYFKKASELGNSAAWFNLGLLYEKGKGVAENIDEAVRCYKEAKKLGNPNAEAKLKSLGL